MINIEDLIGTKFFIHGRSKAQGFDCYGVTIEVAKRNGHTLPDLWYKKVDAQTFNDNAETVIEELSKIVKRTDELKEGNMVVFFEGSKMVHIGTMVDEENFIHCDRSGVRIIPLKSYFRKQYQVYKWV